LHVDNSWMVQTFAVTRQIAPSVDLGTLGHGTVKKFFTDPDCAGG
jgi:hypothetical protein